MHILENEFFGVCVWARTCFWVEEWPTCMNLWLRKVEQILNMFVLVIGKPSLTTNLNWRRKEQSCTFQLYYGSPDRLSRDTWRRLGSLVHWTSDLVTHRTIYSELDTLSLEDKIIGPRFDGALDLGLMTASAPIVDRNSYLTWHRVRTSGGAPKRSGASLDGRSKSTS
jgi:hypothetical protein